MKVVFSSVLARIRFKKIIKLVTLIGKGQEFYSTTSISLKWGSTPRDIILHQNVRIHGVLQSSNNGKIEFGAYSKIGAGTKIFAVKSIKIGAYTAIATNVVICDNNNHPINPIDRRIMRTKPEGAYERSWIHSDYKPIEIGENVWIGENARICKGVIIGNNAIIAASAVVTKNVPANSVVAGNPAKVVKVDIDKTTVSKFQK
ncbi:acyltransferase [Phocaeicola sp.]